MKRFGIIVGMATIISAVYAGLQYHSTGNNIPILPNIINTQKNNILITLNKPEYTSEKSWLLAMYNSALKMPYASDKDSALLETIKAAINNNDLNIAIIAAKNMSYASNKDESLKYIINCAVKNKNNFGYAVLAAEEISYASNKSEALNIIISAAKVFSDNAAIDNTMRQNKK